MFGSIKLVIAGLYGFLGVGSFFCTETLLQTIQTCRYHLVILCPVRCANAVLKPLYDKPFRVVFRYRLVKLHAPCEITAQIEKTSNLRRAPSAAASGGLHL